MLHIREGGSGRIIHNSAEAYDELKDIGLADQETFWLLGLDAKHAVILKEMVFMGGINFSSIDQRVIFHRLIKSLCVSFLCAHNHPSGMLKPSPEDREITKVLRKSANLLNIRFLGHLIITSDGFTEV